ncbi:hypothetical protein [Nocardia farcinica]|uniref:hypothetical protein n=1 Tax=Nocardia farcinica TaxID=37329 RepID=UPI0024556458|nr:hypothetical protein [Nocardia farcinica]
MDIDITCPTCGELDCVQSVPALCADGVMASFETSSYTGLGLSSAGFVPVTGTVAVDRTYTTSLAASFALAPPLRSTKRLSRAGWLLMVPAVLALVPAIGSVVMEDPDVPRWAAVVVAMFFVGALASPGTLTLAAACGRRRINKRITRGRGLARPVWRAGFYCHRCGTGFWPYSPAPGIPARQSLVPQDFRWHVWQAGGYRGY